MCGASLSVQPSAKAEKSQAAVEHKTARRNADATPVPQESAAVVETDRAVDPWWEDESSPAEQSGARAASSEVKSVTTKPAPVEAAKVPPVAAETTRRSEKWWVDEQPGDRVQELREPKRDTPVVEEASKKIEEPPKKEQAPKNGDKWWVESGDQPTTVGGPSFLGLSAGDSTPAGYSYLFQEEEERSHAGRWVALVLLVIAAGVLYFKWQPIRDFVLNTAISHSKPNAPAGQPPAGTDQGTTSSSSGSTTLASSDTPQPTITTDTPKPDQNKQAGSLPNGDKDSATAKTDNSDAAKSDSSAVAKPDTSGPPATAGKPDKTAPAKAASEPSRPAATESKQSAKAQPKQQAKVADDSADDSADDQPATASRKSEPQVNPGGELVMTGEKYLYGRGVARSCDQAVSYFNAAASKQNPQAYSHLGALYATGECVPMDRATAYSYFRRAYAKEPTNHYFEQNLTMLWREMSPDERQRATGGRTTSSF